MLKENVGLKYTGGISDLLLTGNHKYIKNVWPRTIHCADIARIPSKQGIGESWLEISFIPFE